MVCLIKAPIKVHHRRRMRIAEATTTVTILKELNFNRSKKDQMLAQLSLLPTNKFHLLFQLRRLFKYKKSCSTQKSRLRTPKNYQITLLPETRSRWLRIGASPRQTPNKVFQKYKNSLRSLQVSIVFNLNLKFLRPPKIKKLCHFLKTIPRASGPHQCSFKSSSTNSTHKHQILIHKLQDTCHPLTKD